VAVQELCKGQCADLAFEERGEITVGECLAMAEAKTGALLPVLRSGGVNAGSLDKRILTKYIAGH
jgi:geranylgeranyl diphosphate synthase, type I